MNAKKNFKMGSKTFSHFSQLPNVLIYKGLIKKREKKHCEKV